VRVGKNITLQIEAENAENAKQIAENACKQLLANPVMENYTLHISQH
jgi:phosphoribosylformylglycinamidine synthase